MTYQELIDKVASGGVDLDAVEAGLVHGILRRLAIQLRVLLDLGHGELMRDVRGALKRDGRRRNELKGRVFRLKLRERSAASQSPELKEDERALRVHGVRDLEQS